MGFVGRLGWARQSLPASQQAERAGGRQRSSRKGTSHQRLAIHAAHHAIHASTKHGVRETRAIEEELGQRRSWSSGSTDLSSAGGANVLPTPLKRHRDDLL